VEGTKRRFGQMRVPTLEQLNTVRTLMKDSKREVLRPDNAPAFSELVGSVRATLGRRGSAAGLSSEELPLVTAICILAAETNCPAIDLLLHCTALAGLFGAVPGNENRVRVATDCAIAYGCGWRRTLRATHDFRPDEIWSPAFDLLVEQVRDAIGAANRFLGILRPLLREPEVPLLENLLALDWDIAASLAWRLVRPLNSTRAVSGDFLEVEGRAADDSEAEYEGPVDGAAEFRGELGNLHPLPAGARYVFDVNSGIALAAAAGRVLAAGSGGRFVIRASDFGSVEISFPVGSNLGRLLRFDCSTSATLSAVAGPVSLAQWECGCGSWACPERHRLSSWLPNEDLGLKDFVNSAINGRDNPTAPKSFVAGMYYSYLSREGWGNN
jgi:hypothetical protein